MPLVTLLPKSFRASFEARAFPGTFQAWKRRGFKTPKESLRLPKNNSQRPLLGSAFPSLHQLTLGFWVSKRWKAPKFPFLRAFGVRAVLWEALNMTSPQLVGFPLAFPKETRQIPWPLEIGGVFCTRGKVHAPPHRGPSIYKGGQSMVQMDRGFARSAPG